MRSQLMPFTGVEPVGALPEPKVEPKQEPEKRKRDAGSWGPSIGTCLTKFMAFSACDIKMIVGLLHFVRKLKVLVIFWPETFLSFSDLLFSFNLFEAFSIFSFCSTRISKPF